MKSTKHRYRNSYAKYELYNNKLSFAEETKCDDNGFLQVKCTYCGKWYNPTISSCDGRIRSLGGEQNGESRFYCSEGCKQSCPIFNQKK
jgi:hypothetical protein